MKEEIGKKPKKKEKERCLSEDSEDSELYGYENSAEMDLEDEDK